MNKSVSLFLRSHRVSVVGILQENNRIHSATLHFANAEDPVAFYVWTGKSSRKCQSLLDGEARSASLVIGFDESEFATFQAEGKIKLLSDTEELRRGWETYGEKFPDRLKKRDEPDMVLLCFIPLWWRYADLRTTTPTKISSEDEN